MAPRIQVFLSELRRRKVTRVALVYVIVGLGLIEAADLILPTLRLQGAFPFVVVLVLLGFPIAVVLAWAVELTPDGIRRTAAPLPNEPALAGAEGWSRRRTAFALVGLIAVLIAGYFAFVQDPGRASSGNRLAVLPFENLSGDPSNEYFSDGIAGDLINHLSRIEGLDVVSRTSSFQYRQTGKSVPAIAAELGANVILEGEVQRIDDRVRINTQLIDAQTDVHLWSEQYDRQLTDVFSIQSEIAQAIARELHAVLTPEESAKIEAGPTENVEAYRLYLLGTYHWNRFTEDGARRSIEYFDQAIAMDSAYALAHAGLADAYMVLGLGFGRGAAEPGEVMPRAKEAARRAIDLAPDSPHGYSVLGMLSFTYDYDYSEAERLLARALELDPDLQITHARSALLFTVLGMHQEAIAANLRALELDPRRLITATDRGWILLHAGRPDDALEAAAYARELDPDFTEVEWLTARALMARGRYADAIPHLIRMEEAYAENPKQRAGLGHAYARSGDEAEARRILAELLAWSERRYVSPKWIGFLYLGLREDELAIDWFEKGVDARADWMHWVQYLPGVERLRSNERYRSVLRRMNLSAADSG